MSLKSKILLILIPVIVLYTCAYLLINRFILLPQFLSLELTEAAKNVRRPAQAIEREIHHLSGLVHDWSAWDDTYDFAVSKSPDYVTDNIPISSFIDNQLNLISICDTKGNVLFGKLLNLKTKQQIKLPEIPEDKFPAGHPLISYDASVPPLSSVKLSGVMLTSSQPMLIASRPVLTNDNFGPIRGSVIMGRFLTDKVIKNLAEQTEVGFDVIPLESDTSKFASSNLRALISGKATSYIDIVDKSSLIAYTMVSDINGKPALLIKVPMKRDIAKKGYLSMQYALVSFIVLGVCILLIMMILFHVTIIKPLSYLTRHTLAIGETGDLSSRLNFKRKDEIGRLARKLDLMFEQLSEARNRLLEQTYYSGLAGMTSDIIHNAGNILMPVSLKISTLIDKCKSIPFDTINQAMKELDDAATTPARKEAMLRYLNLSVNTMHDVIRESETQLGEIAGHFSEIEKVLVDLDEFSRSGIVTEPLSPEEIIHSALGIMPRKLKKNIRFNIKEEIQSLPTIIAERIVLIQVVTTTLNVAAEHTTTLPNESPAITIGGHLETAQGHSAVRLTISDNGAALTREMIRQIFSRNFKGSGKYKHLTGLHWCSNVISAMNGSLTAEPGKGGTGTCFHLVLPVKEAP